MGGTFKISCLVLAVLVVSGCASLPAYRSNPQLHPRIKTTHTITLIPLRTDVYQISAGGVGEKMDEWSSQAKRNVIDAIQQELSFKPMLNVKPFAETLLSEEKMINLEETAALFDAVSYSIIIHTYGPPEQRFAEKVTNFDYSLGAEISELSDGADAILIVSCFDQIATAGRKAVQAGSIILGALVGVQLTQQIGVTVVNVALVDAGTGDILWYNRHASGGDHDLRNPINTYELIKVLFKDFPR